MLTDATARVLLLELPDGQVGVFRSGSCLGKLEASGPPSADKAHRVTAIRQ